MPTRAGWGVLSAAATSLATGRVLGWVEGYLIGTGLMLLTLGAVAWARARRLDLSVARLVEPTTIRVGTRARVRLGVRNRSRRRTPVLRLEDRMGAEETAESLLAPIERQAYSSVGYPLPTDVRGSLRLGPLQVVVEDPFGLARAVTSALGSSTVTVHPHVDPIPPPPVRGGARADGPRHPSPRDDGEDVHGLRDYVDGDDPRLVHWPTSARLDQLVVRQFERPRAGRTVVALDTSSGVGPSFEAGVSAAASVAVAAGRRGDEVTLVTGSTTAVEPGRGGDHVHRLLDHLADVAGGAAATGGPPDPGDATLVTIVPAATGRGPVTIEITAPAVRRRTASVPDLAAVPAAWGALVGRQWAPGHRVGA